MNERVHARAILLALAILAGSSGLPVASAAQEAATIQVPVEVVEVAGGRVYVAPGESAGLRRGDRVELGKQSFEVIAVCASSAVIDGKGRAWAAGKRGTAFVHPAAESGPKRLPPPQPLAAFVGQWPRPRMPASTQHPKPVPLGSVKPQGHARASLSLGAAGVAPLSGAAPAFARGELRAKLHYEPLRELPLRLDADAAAQLWLASNLDESSRPPVRVRELQLAYGEQSALFGALGRLRYASRTLGMLDGARVQAPIVGGLTLGAFGGFVPDPLDGSPATDASRFGAEVGYEDASLSLRPRVALDAHASRFDGKLDERKLTALFDLFPADSRVSGYTELSLYDRDNPWGAPSAELSAAGADASVRLGVVELGARADMQRPERSRWLAAYLPEGFLCTTQSASPSTPGEPCNGDDARYLASADVGLRLSRVALTLGGQLSRTEHADAEQTGGFLALTVLRIVSQVRLDSSLSASTGSVMDSAALNVGLGSAFFRDVLDVSIRYRPALNRYLADTGSFVEHSAGASVLVHATSDLDLSADADAIAGRDVDVLLVQSLLAWRPSF